MGVVKGINLTFALNLRLNLREKKHPRFEGAQGLCVKCIKLTAALNTRGIRVTLLVLLKGTEVRQLGLLSKLGLT